ncbi:MAG: aminotransferase DegT [Rhodospirillaceae bacterium]|nr:aminotransferase DegT [Magnetovibrio sp.]MAY67230.1 aminotransferase DegT [Rhodospirillaceae bacterium]
MTEPVRAIVDAVTRVIDSPGRAVPLHEPRFAGREWEYVKDCLDTGWVSSVGAYVDRFERDLAEMTGADHAVATVNGTAALHLCLIAAGVRPGDEVIVPALSFVATANAVAYCHAQPHFADIQPDTLGLDPDKLANHLAAVTERRDGRLVNRETGNPITAIVVMHAFGHPADMDGLIAVAADFGLPLIEDAAESLGSTYKGRHCGALAPLAALSFNGNKTVTTGGGGAVLVRDAETAARIKHLSTTAKVPHRWEYVHDAVAFNYRMPNINAALGCAQLEQLPGFLDAKRRLAKAYANAFAEVTAAEFVAAPPDCESNYWLNAILVDGAVPGLRDDVLTVLNDAGVMARPAWALLNTLPAFTGSPRMTDLTIAEDVGRRLINLPSSAALGEI